MTDQPSAPDPAQPTDQHEGSAPHVRDDHGEALRRSAQSIEEAEAAEGEVAAHDDITTLDDQRAGEFSEDPDGAGGT